MAGASGQQTTQPMNVNTASAQALQRGGLGTAQAQTFDPGTLAQTNLQQYQDPYTQQVIDASAQDVLRNAQLGLNQLSGQAQQAGAFGGSRHGVAMGEIGRGVAQMLGQQSAQLRSQGFQNAQNMAQQDIQNRLAGAEFRLGASGQMADIGNLGFGIGQQINQNMMQQGAMQQALQQQLIDQAKGQYQGYTGAPAQSIGYVSSALGASPIPVSTTQTRQPGLFDYLTLAATAASGSNFGNPTTVYGRY